jgi:hypothetical protein
MDRRLIARVDPWWVKAPVFAKSEFRPPTLIFSNGGRTLVQTFDFLYQICYKDSGRRRQARERAYKPIPAIGREDARKSRVRLAVSNLDLAWTEGPGVEPPPCVHRESWASKALTVTYGKTLRPREEVKSETVVGVGAGRIRTAELPIRNRACCHTPPRPQATVSQSLPEQYEISFGGRTLDSNPCVRLFDSARFPPSPESKRFAGRYTLDGPKNRRGFPQKKGLS